MGGVSGCHRHRVSVWGGASLGERGRAFCNRVSAGAACVGEVPVPTGEAGLRAAGLAMATCPTPGPACPPGGAGLRNSSFRAHACV